jgi:hypothetical protein
VGIVSYTRAVFFFFTAILQRFPLSLFFLVLNFAKIKKGKHYSGAIFPFFLEKNRKISNSWNIYIIIIIIIILRFFFPPLDFEFSLVVFSYVVILLFYLGS